MKILKFKENFMDKDLSWKDMSDEERSKREIPAYKDLKWVKDFNKCNCCEECTGEEGCFCGCPDCLCEGISEAVKYHLDNKKPIVENIFRAGSDAFFDLINESRILFESGRIELSEVDRAIFETTDLGKKEYYKGELVQLDLPMLNEEWIAESNEYKGKKVKLNKPMRSSGPKKYKVYVKNPKTGNVMVVNFGDVKGGLKSKINDPEAVRAFVARHDCKSKNDKTKPSYWSCRLPRYAKMLGLSDTSKLWW